MCFKPYNPKRVWLVFLKLTYFFLNWSSRDLRLITDSILRISFSFKQNFILFETQHNYIYDLTTHLKDVHSKGFELQTCWLWSRPCICSLYYCQKLDQKRLYYQEWLLVLIMIMLYTWGIVGQLLTQI